jgi:hypothetical protein
MNRPKSIETLHMPCTVSFWYPGSHCCPCDTLLRSHMLQSSVYPFPAVSNSRQTLSCHHNYLRFEDWLARELTICRFCNNNKAASIDCEFVNAAGVALCLTGAVRFEIQVLFHTYAYLSVPVVGNSPYLVGHSYSH